MLAVSLDGTPHSLIMRRAEQPGSIWPRLFERGTIRRIRSSRPEMSSVAWASYLTGANPGEHGVFGFVEPQFTPRPRLSYPNGSQLRRPPIHRRVHDAGRVPISINVPMTSPPAPVSGVVVGGFLGVTLAGNVHPPELERELQRAGYIVDPDPALAYRDRARFLAVLFDALEKRVALAERLAIERDWDYFHLHVMETDRLFHFFWDEQAYAAGFNELLVRCERAVERFARIAAAKNAALVVLSDHGFTRSRRIVFVNALLEKAGLLSYRGGKRSFAAIDPRSQAFALAPGRIFLHRTPHAPGSRERRERAGQLAGVLRQVVDPETREPPFASVDHAADLYAGPEIVRAPDLVILPRDGYDLKADFDADRVFATPEVLVGTHRYGDAFFYATEGPSAAWEDDEREITDAGRAVASLLALPGTAGSSDFAAVTGTTPSG